MIKKKKKSHKGFANHSFKIVKSIIVCEGCGEKFEHYTRRVTNSKKFCDFCLYKNQKSRYHERKKR